MSVLREWKVETFADVVRAFRAIRDVLQRLTFADNFESFEEEVTIGATSEVSVVNKLDTIPSRYLVMEMVGDGTVRKGSTTWTSELLYLRNPSASSVTAKVRFFV